MADWQYQPRKPAAAASITASFLRKLREHAPHSTRLTGLATLLISGAILLFLSGLTITATLLTFICITPLILISSPIWIPLTILFIISATLLLSLIGFAVAAAAALSWLYRYFKGRSDHPNPKEYARDPYGGYFQSTAKDAAPGA